MFRCVTTISPNITKVRPVLAAGWTSSGVNEATARFGNVYLNYMDASPVFFDSSLKTEIVYENLTSSMAFLGDDDFLILEKDSGAVERITNGTKHDSPLIDLNVTSADGLIGIAVDKLLGNGSQVYLYYSASPDGDCGSCASIGNKLVRYNLVNNKTALVNPKVLLDLPAPDNTSAMHNGGPVLIGPDNNIYLSVGDLHSIPESGTGNATYNQAINYPNGSYADGRAGILRITKDGSSVGQIGILGDSKPLSLYFAYGIRNSFGMDFDPVSGKLWITDNGPDLGDEINLVEAGFNGGWAALAGSTIMSNNTYYSRLDFPSSLFDFDGKGHYRSPEFEWKNTIGPTAMSFIDSKSLGDKYENALFVADWLGNLYLFELSENRSGFLLEEELYDKIADTPEETEINKIGEGFGLVTDLKMGMDGSLYLVSLVPGKVYKIMLRE
jgi:aldose sugar dehydrogenase